MPDLDDLFYLGDVLVRPRVVALLLFVAAILFLDLETKQWVIDNLAGQPPIELTTFLNLVYAENTGVAFGIFAGGGDAVRYALLSATAVLSLVLLVMLLRASSWVEGVVWALMLGGALGNFIDRLRFGHVVDFIDMHGGEYHWPAFNVADMAICAGAMLAAVWLFKSGGDAPQSSV